MWMRCRKPKDDPETYSADDIQKMKDAGTYNDKVKELSGKKSRRKISAKDIEDIGNFKYGYGFQFSMSQDTTPNQVLTRRPTV